MLQLKKLLRILPVSLLLIILSVSGCTDNKPEAPLIPVEDFFRKPDKTDFQLSPDGKYVAFLQPWEGRVNLYLQNIDDSSVVRMTSFTNKDVNHYFWKSDDRIIIFPGTHAEGGCCIYTLNVDTKEAEQIASFKNAMAAVVNKLPFRKNEMLIKVNDRDERVFDLYKINLNTGNRTLIEKNPGNVTDWVVDRNGDVKLANAVDGTDFLLLKKNESTDKWQLLRRHTYNETMVPKFYNETNNLVYAVSNIDRDTESIVLFDPEKNKIIETVYKHPEVDVYKLEFSPSGDRVVGVKYTTSKTSYTFFDDRWSGIYGKIKNHLLCCEIHIVSADLSEEKFLIRAINDKSYGSYYYYNTVTNEFRKLADASPWINESEMANCEPITFRSRDGLTIHGYLTFPKGVNHTNLPVVVIPHPGPWKRDTWGYDPQVQFLANRGYAVLQINYRGSVGYGKKFWMAGYKQWGREMQNDITDGVKWLIRQEIADPERIAIFGQSYGGYAAIWGLITTPELYKCGASHSGITNLFTLLEAIPPYWEPFKEMFYKEIGNPVKDKEMLKSVSPIYHYKKIEDPLFIAMGTKDPKVKLSETDKIIAYLKGSGIDNEYIVRSDEGHVFKKEENLYTFYTELEKFLARHIKGRYQKYKVN